MNRRNFLKSIGAIGLISTLPRTLSFAGGDAGSQVRIGVFTDLHHMSFKKDETARMKLIMDAMLQEKPDLMIEGGDFTYPKNIEPVLAEWNRFDGPKYHVLGNHDMDYCDKATITKLLGMENRYYSFDHGAFHFAVLDRNNFRKADGSVEGYAKGNWYKAGDGKINQIDPEQMAWIRDDLTKTTKPTVLWMHQPIAATDELNNIGNGQELLDLIDEMNFTARQSTGKPRVIAAFFGHDHTDVYTLRNDVHYIMLNSASYAYHGGGPYYYQDPLFCFVTLDPAGTIQIKGKSSVYGPAPVPERIHIQIPSRISDRSLVT